jgi:hypothetical protein
VWSAALGGAAAGLAALAHPYAAAYVGAGCILLLIERRWTASLAFALAAALVVTPYAVDLFTHLDEVRIELASPIAAAKGSITPLSFLSNLLSEHVRLFRRLDIGVSTLMLVVGTITAFRSRDRSRRALVVYTLLVVALCGALNPDKVETRYAILALPFMSMIGGWLLARLPESRAARWLRCAAVALGILALGVGIAADLRCLTRHQTWSAARNDGIARSIPRGATVIAPLAYVYGGLGRHRVLGLFDIAAANGAPLDLATLAPAARRLGASRIIELDDADPIERLAPTTERVPLPTGVELIDSGAHHRVWNFAAETETFRPQVR